MSLLTQRVRAWFGLPARRSPTPRPTLPVQQLLSAFPAPGQILLLSGPSGAGKSTLLEQYRAHCKNNQIETIDLNEIAMSTARRGKTVVEVVADAFAQRQDNLEHEKRRLVRALRQLSAVGLAEAGLYLRPPVELSEGQRFRLRLALGLVEARRANVENIEENRQIRARRGRVLLCDEFAASLDDVTAAVVARAVRRVIDPTDEGSPALIVASGRAAVSAHLSCDREVRCDFARWRIDAIEFPPVARSRRDQARKHRNASATNQSA
jgi:ABC-type ATPase with predicted acetyltransferase domain